MQIWQGSGKEDGKVSAPASVKLFVRLDLRNGTLEGPVLTAGRHTDTRSPLSLDDIPAGGLYLADLGFASGQRFEQIVGKAAGLRGADKRYFLSRLLPKMRLQTRRGHRIELRGILPQQVGERVELGVILPTAGRLPVRLILERVPEEVAEWRREHVREAARLKATSSQRGGTGTLRVEHAAHQCAPPLAHHRASPGADPSALAD